MAASTSAFYSVQYQPTPAVLRGTVLQPLSALEFTEACEMLLHAARHHRCPYWLLDGRADANFRTPDVYEWLGDEFLPRVQRELGRMPMLAFLARAGFRRKLHAQNAALPTVVGGAFRSAWFTDESTALDWLASFRSVRPDSLP